MSGMSAVAVDEALRCSLGRLLRSIWPTQTNLATIVSLLNVRQGCVRVSVCVTLLGRLLLFWVANTTTRMFWYALLPNYRPIRWSLHLLPAWFISFYPFQLCSIIIWTYKGHCVLKRKCTFQSPHLWFSSLKTGLAEFIFNFDRNNQIN